MADRVIIFSEPDRPSVRRTAWSRFREWLWRRAFGGEA